MDERENPRDDPLIDEIRHRRRELLSKHEDDLTRLSEAIRSLQAQHPEKVVDLRKSRRSTTQP